MTIMDCGVNVTVVKAWYNCDVIVLDLSMTVVQG